MADLSLYSRFSTVLLMLFALFLCSVARSVVPGASTLAHLSAELRSFNLSIVSWNMAERTPRAKDCSFLRRYRSSDIVVFGIQECEDIRPRRREGHRTRKWRELQRNALGKQFQCIGSHKMGGLFIAAYAKKPVARMVQRVLLMDVACGIGNVLTNKGATCIAMQLQNRTIAFINSHLAAHVKHVKRRNEDYRRIMESLVHGVSDGVEEKGPVGYPSPRGKAQGASSSRTRLRSPGGVGRTSRLRSIQSKPKTVRSSALASRVQDMLSAAAAKTAAALQPFDAVVFFGDLNYRVDLPREEILRLHDRLRRHRNSSRASLASHSLTPRSERGDQHRDLDLPGIKAEEAASDNCYFPADQTAALPPGLKRRLQRVLRHDQLNKQLRRGRAFEGFEEGFIRFPPTYKYDKGADCFDTSAKQRTPAWTDRILYRVRGTQTTQPVGSTRTTAPHQALTDGASSAERLTRAEAAVPRALLRLKSYYSVDAQTSDHRPVCAEFELDLS